MPTAPRHHVAPRPFLPARTAPLSAPARLPWPDPPPRRDGRSTTGRLAPSRRPAPAPGSRRSLTRPLPQVEPLSTRPPRPTCPNPFTAVSPHVLALALASRLGHDDGGGGLWADPPPGRAAVWPRGVLLALPSLGRNSSKSVRYPLDDEQASADLAGSNYSPPSRRSVSPMLASQPFSRPWPAPRSRPDTYRHPPLAPDDALTHRASHRLGSSAAVWACPSPGGIGRPLRLSSPARPDLFY